MPKPFISARIPESVNTAIEKRAENTGESRTDILLNALSAYLKGDIKLPKSIDERLSKLENEFAQIREKARKSDQGDYIDNNFDNDVIIDNPDNVLDNNVDNEKSKQRKSKDDYSFDNTIESSKKQWTTKELELTGISRKTVEYRLKNGKLPYEKNGVTVYSRIGKETRDGRVTSIWEVSAQG